MSKRVTAAGNVQRGLFNLRKVMCGAFFFFSFAAAAITHFMFSSSKKKKKRAGGIRKQSGVKGLGSQKPGQDFLFFFLGTLDFLGNYINSGVFKSVFCRQKGGKL